MLIETTVSTTAVCELAVENDELLKVKDSRDIIIALTERVHVRLREEVKELKSKIDMPSRDIEFSDRMGR